MRNQQSERMGQQFDQELTYSMEEDASVQKTKKKKILTT